MARVRSGKMTGNDRAALERELVQSIRGLTRDETWRFLHDLLTPGEIIMLGRRLRIAKALLRGDLYEDIAVKQKASFSTIQLVDQAIQRGLEGYRRVIERARQDSKKVSRRPPNETIETLRRLPGAGRFRFWLDLLDDGEEK